MSAPLAYNHDFLHFVTVTVCFGKTQVTEFGEAYRYPLKG